VHSNLLSCSGDQSGRFSWKAMLVDRINTRMWSIDVVEALENNFNISNEPNENRSMWIESLMTSDQRSKEKAHVIYFVGCVAAFYPMAHKFPRPSSDLDKAKVDFTILGERSGAVVFP